MRIASAIHSAALAAAACLVCPGTASALSDLVINVNCSSQSIGQALNRPTVFDRRLVIVVSGTCNENVTIARDDVTIRSAGGGGVAPTSAGEPAILVDAAKRVLLENLAVTGGHDGVHITGGGSATIRAATVRGAVFTGIVFMSGASGRVEDSLVEDNGHYGIEVNGSTATVVSSVVRNNGYSGVVSQSGGALTLGQINDAGNVCCGNTIERNRLDGVSVARTASARMWGNMVQNNGTATNRFGVLAVEQSLVWLDGGNVLSGNGGPNGGGGAFVRASSLRTGQGDQPVFPSTNQISNNFIGIATQTANLDLRGGLVVSGNQQSGINVEQGSRLRSDGSNISGNLGRGIFVTTASGVHFINVKTVVTANGQGGLVCLDAGSHVSGDTTGIDGNPNVNVSCSPF